MISQLRWSCALCLCTLHVNNEDDHLDIDNDGMIDDLSEHMKHFRIGSDPITMHLLFP